MSEVWIGALAGTVIGAGVSLYGANKQSKDAAHAQDLNLAANAGDQRANWNSYLMTRGVTPGADNQVGQVPGRAPGSNMNTRLPAWLNVTTPNVPTNTPADQKPFLVDKV